MKPKRSVQLDVYAHGGEAITSRSRFMKTPDVFRTGIERSNYDKKTPGGELSKTVEKQVKKQRGRK